MIYACGSVRMGAKMNFAENDAGRTAEEKDGNAEFDRANLMYEIESAKRQITALQALISGKNKETALLQNRLIEQEVLLKQAAACIAEAMELCRKQAVHSEDSGALYRRYEEEWQSLSLRLGKVQKELPAGSFQAVIPTESASRLSAARSDVQEGIRKTEESLRLLFDEE